MCHHKCFQFIYFSAFLQAVLQLWLIQQSHHLSLDYQSLHFVNWQLITLHESVIYLFIYLFLSSLICLSLPCSLSDYSGSTPQTAHEEMRYWHLLSPSASQPTSSKEQTRQPLGSNTNLHLGCLSSGL